MLDPESHEAWNLAREDPGILLVDDVVSIWLIYDNIEWLLGAILTWGFWFF